MESNWSEPLNVTVSMPGDLDHDGDVDQSDLGILLSDWGCTGGGCVGDMMKMILNQLGLVINQAYRMMVAM